MPSLKLGPPEGGGSGGVGHPFPCLRDVGAPPTARLHRKIRRLITPAEPAVKVCPQKNGPARCEALPRNGRAFVARRVDRRTASHASRAEVRSRPRGIRTCWTSLAYVADYRGVPQRVARQCMSLKSHQASPLRRPTRPHCSCTPAGPTTPGSPAATAKSSSRAKAPARTELTSSSNTEEASSRAIDVPGPAPSSTSASRQWPRVATSTDMRLAATPRLTRVVERAMRFVPTNRPSRRAVVSRPNDSTVCVTARRTASTKGPTLEGLGNLTTRYAVKVPGPLKHTCDGPSIRDSVATAGSLDRSP